MTANEQDFEAGFWGDCCNTFVEETKQFVYARLMGVRREHFSFRVYGNSILDIGGGPVSMLLKCHDLGRGLVVDPLLDKYPPWILDRYATKGIQTCAARGEDLPPFVAALPFDECWIYNVCQHVDDVEVLLENALRACRLLRIFEWVNVKPHEGHPQLLTKKRLDDALACSPQNPASRSLVTPLSYEGCWGDAYHVALVGRGK